MVRFHDGGMIRRILPYVRSGVLILLCILGGFLLVAYWFSEGHGASLAKLEQVKPGMTRNEVLSLLGNPGTINGHQDGPQSWFYTRGTFCQVKVYLDRNGIVLDTNHDH